MSISRVQEAENLLQRYRYEPRVGISLGYAPWWEHVVKHVTGYETIALMEKLDDERICQDTNICDRYSMECAQKGYDISYLWTIIWLLESKHNKRSRNFKLKPHKGPS